MKKISIIGQCYNEQQMLPIYYQEICQIMKQMDDVEFELIFVDDHSTDSSLSIIKTLAVQDHRVKCLSMSRNFGKASCCIAGLKYATGDYIVTMDIDLQDPPSLLPQMLKSIQIPNIDIVATIATTRKGYSVFQKFCIGIFYKLFNALSSIKIQDGQRDYRMMTQQVVNAILEHKEYNLFDKGYFADVGFNTMWLCYENIERPAGETKWPFSRLLRFSINGILGYSVTPLKLVLYFGLCTIGAAAITLLIAIVLATLSGSMKYILLLLIAGILALFGIQVTLLGVLALYIAQIHMEVKQRSRFIIREFINMDDCC